MVPPAPKTSSSGCGVNSRMVLFCRFSSRTSWARDIPPINNQPKTTRTCFIIVPRPSACQQQQDSLTAEFRRTQKSGGYCSAGYAGDQAHPAQIKTRTCECIRLYLG